MFLYSHRTLRARLPRTQPEAQQRRWSGYLRKDCAAGVRFPLPTTKQTLPITQLCHQAGADACRKQAECPWSPAAAELTRPPWQPPAPTDNLMHSPCLPERALQEKEKENSVSLLSSPLTKKPQSSLGILHLVTALPRVLWALAQGGQVLLSPIHPVTPMKLHLALLQDGFCLKRAGTGTGLLAVN